MKVLVSTSQTQGARDNDFHWTQDGELVYVGFVSCSAPVLCGCGRSFSGMDSMKGTTTAVVEERKLTLTEYANLVAAAMTRAGWTFVEPARVARELRDLAAHFDVGDVLERQDDTTIAVRRAS